MSCELRDHASVRSAASLPGLSHEIPWAQIEPVGALPSPPAQADDGLGRPGPLRGCSYVGPRSAPRRTDHDTFEIQTVHVQPRIDRHAPTRPSLVRVSQLPVEPAQWSGQLRTRRWPYVVVSAIATAWLLCWYAWPTENAARAARAAGPTAQDEPPRPASTSPGHAAFSRESTEAAGPTARQRSKGPSAPAGDTGPQSVARPASPDGQSRLRRGPARSSTTAAIAPEQQPREHTPATSADEQLLKRVPWPE
jgi:hypothetical protein